MYLLLLHQPLFSTIPSGDVIRPSTSKLPLHRPHRYVPFESKTFLDSRSTRVSIRPTNTFSKAGYTTAAPEHHGSTVMVISWSKFGVHLLERLFGCVSTETRRGLSRSSASRWVAEHLPIGRKDTIMARLQEYFDDNYPLSVSTPTPEAVLTPAIHPNPSLPSYNGMLPLSLVDEDTILVDELSDYLGQPLNRQPS